LGKRQLNTSLTNDQAKDQIGEFDPGSE